MDNKALYKLSYGVFVLGTKSGDKMNACITNTCMQVANDPVRVAISAINRNYTCDLIKESRQFALTVLDKTVSFDTIKRFGFQTGREVDKFADFKPQIDDLGNPYIAWQSCAVISCKVLSATDLGSHTLFVAEIVDAKVLSDNPPLTYADYQSDVKPKPEKHDEKKKIKGWKCKICGYIYEGETLPADYLCPLCGHDASDFEPIYE